MSLIRLICCFGIIPESTVAELRENVASRGGTTAAALEVLMAQDGLTPLIERAAKAAKQRTAQTRILLLSDFTSAAAFSNSSTNP